MALMIEESTKMDTGVKKLEEHLSQVTTLIKLFFYVNFQNASKGLL